MGICPVRHNVRDMALALERGAVLWSRQNVWDWLSGFGELVLMCSFGNSDFLRKGKVYGLFIVNTILLNYLSYFTYFNCSKRMAFLKLFKEILRCYHIF